MRALPVTRIHDANTPHGLRAGPARKIFAFETIGRAYDAIDGTPAGKIVGDPKSLLTLATSDDAR